jgi:hypothetical protein
MCYETEAFGIKSYIWTTTRGKAVSVTLNSARDANYQVKFTDIKVSRRQTLDDYDLLDRKIQLHRPYAPDYI